MAGGSKGAQNSRVIINTELIIFYSGIIIESRCNKYCNTQPPIAMYHYFLPSVDMFPRAYKIGYRSSVRAVRGWQGVMQQDIDVAMHHHHHHHQFICHIFISNCRYKSCNCRSPCRKTQSSTSWRPIINRTVVNILLRKFNQ